MNYYNLSDSKEWKHTCTSGLAYSNTGKSTGIAIGMRNIGCKEQLAEDIAIYPWLQGIVNSTDDIFDASEITEETLPENPVYIDMIGKDLYKLHHLLVWIRYYDEGYRINEFGGYLAQNKEICEAGVAKYGKRFAQLLDSAVFLNGHSPWAFYYNKEEFLDLFLAPEKYKPLKKYVVSKDRPICWLEYKSESLVKLKDVNWGCIRPQTLLKELEEREKVLFG